MAADELIVVTTPEPTAITDAYGLIKALCQQDFTGKIYLVVNRVLSAQEASIVFEKLLMATSKFLNYEIESLGFIVEDSKVGQAIQAQKPFLMTYPQTTAANNLYNIAAKITNQENLMPASKGIKGFFSKVIGYFR